MKTAIKQPPSQIDWSKPQLVKSKSGSLFVFTTGNETDLHFEGIVVHADKSCDDNIGSFYDMWERSDFVLATEVVELSND